MVRRDRNHPCIIMWSIGNEVDYARTTRSPIPSSAHAYKPENPPALNLSRSAMPLVEAVQARWISPAPSRRRWRPPTMSNAVGFADIPDVAGYNYQEAHLRR